MKIEENYISLMIHEMYQYRKVILREIYYLIRGNIYVMLISIFENDFI